MSALRRLRGERGFTLIEMMVACMVGVVIVLAAFSVLDNSVQVTANVTNVVDSTQRARVAMDRVARALRSTVCTSSSPAIVAATPTSVTFLEFTGSGAVAPDEHQIRLNGNTLENDDYGTNIQSPPQQPLSRSVLLTDASPEPSNSTPPIQYNTPVFAYYAFGADPSQGATTALTNTPLSATDRAAVARITIRFMARVSGSTSDTRATHLQTDVYSRTWDPNGTNGASPPTCL